MDPSSDPSVPWGERGQASVELVATLPALLAVGAVCWQIALAGHALWMSSQAARAAARADLIGRDAVAAARSNLPGYLEPGLRVQHVDGGVRVRVRVRVPLVLPGWRSPVTVGATTSLGAVDR